jgi:hypothetical protein
MDSFTLSRNWFNYSFENPEKIKPNHTALYFFIIEHCNRLGGKEKFGLPTTMAKEAIGIKSYNTYISTLNDLVDWGFIKMIEKSKNQYSSNIVAISNFNKALNKALDKALIKHSTKHMIKQDESTVQSIDSIDKQRNKETKKQFIIPTIEEIKTYCIERKNNVDANRWFDFYSSKGWMIGKNKMSDWKAAIRTWETNKKDKIVNRSNGVLSA